MTDHVRAILAVAGAYGERRLPEHLVMELVSLLDDEAVPGHLQRDARQLLRRNETARDLTNGQR